MVPVNASVRLPSRLYPSQAECSPPRTDAQPVETRAHGTALSNTLPVLVMFMPAALRSCLVVTLA